MAEYELSDELIQNVEAFVSALKTHPDILQVPKLSFFREYLLSLGAKVTGEINCIICSNKLCATHEF
jgi:hypothetical protein